MSRVSNTRTQREDRRSSGHIDDHEARGSTQNWVVQGRLQLFLHTRLDMVVLHAFDLKGGGSSQYSYAFPLPSPSTEHVTRGACRAGVYGTRVQVGSAADSNTKQNTSSSDFPARIGSCSSIILIFANRISEVRSEQAEPADQQKRSTHAPGHHIPYST